MNIGNHCPRCTAGQLKNWEQLDQEEQEVVKRLPASTEYTLEERRTNHRWCTRCWFEARENFTQA